MRGFVSEIYSTFQGEGLSLGERQIFVRLAGCPWRCRYCDTPASLVRDGHEELSAEDALDRIHHLQEEREHKTVAVTGGEPLAQPEFLAELLPGLRRLGLRTHLETSGTLPAALARVIDHCDVVAMDVKLPSAVGRDFWDAHAEFLRLAGAKAFVKIVVTSDTPQREFERAVALVSAQNPVPPVILQPVTPVEELARRLNGDTNGQNARLIPPPPNQMVKWWDWALHRLPDVRLIPQLHPMWGVP
jgi:7-carboxy-7-deazaguanine synthase